VRHSHLWERLQAYGITGNVLACIQSLYAQSAVPVNVNGQYTDFVEVMIGLRQGDPLSPILFGLFIEVLEQDIKRAVGSQSVAGACTRTPGYSSAHAPVCR
jgi:hypothetical protein